MISKTKFAEAAARIFLQTLNKAGKRRVINFTYKMEPAEVDGKPVVTFHANEINGSICPPYQADLSFEYEWYQFLNEEQEYDDDTINVDIFSVVIELRNKYIPVEIQNAEVVQANKVLDYTAKMIWHNEYRCAPQNAPDYPMISGYSKFRELNWLQSGEYLNYAKETTGESNISSIWIDYVKEEVKKQLEQIVDKVANNHIIAVERREDNNLTDWEKKKAYLLTQKYLIPTTMELVTFESYLMQEKAEFDKTNWSGEEFNPGNPYNYLPEIKVRAKKMLLKEIDQQVDKIEILSSLKTRIDCDKLYDKALESHKQFEEIHEKWKEEWLFGGKTRRQDEEPIGDGFELIFQGFSHYDKKIPPWFSPAQQKDCFFNYCIDIGVTSSEIRPSEYIYIDVSGPKHEETESLQEARDGLEGVA